jgi:hypothetical protein
VTCSVRVQLASPSVEGSLNPAYVETSFVAIGTSGLTIAEVTARQIAYVTNAMRTCAHEGVQIVGADYRATPTDPYMPQPFPYTEYSAIAADFDDSVHLPDMSTYNSGDVGYSGFTSSGRGDSLCISYRSTAPGRHSKGRNFFPFLARQAVTTQGLISSATATGIELGFDVLLNGAGTGVLAESAFPEVYSKALTTGYPIVSFVVAQVPSRLRSRTK